MVGVDVSRLEHDIRTAAITRRMRPALFFLDYDKLRSGLVTSSQFFRVLWENMSVKLSEEEEAAMAAKYACKDGRIEWRRFVNTIGLPFDPTDVTTDPACQRVEAREWLGTDRSLKPLDIEDEVYMEQLLRRLQRYYSWRGIDVRQLMHEYDTHKNGVIHESQFYRSMPKPLSVVEEDIALLVQKYRDPERLGLLNYINLANDLDAIGAVMASENRTQTDFVRDITDYIPHELRPDQAVQDIMDRIRVAVYRNGVRTTEFFKDYDRLRSGRITERQFLTALKLAIGKEAHLIEGDGERIVGFYRCPDGSVDYREFCEMLENAFNIPHLEKKPTQTVVRPPTGSLRGILPILTEEEERRADEVLNVVRDVVFTQRIHLYPIFKDFDRSKAHTGIVTPTQFGRILAMFKVNVNPEDLRLLCRKFADTTTGDINYPAFVQCVDKMFVNYAVERLKDYDCPPDCPKVECEIKDDEEVDTQQLMERLRHHVLVNSIRVKQYFEDFDTLHSGSVTKAQFERGLSYMGLSALGQHHLSTAQLAAICHIYEDPNDSRKVAWHRFAADMESVFTLPNLEYTPSVQVPPSCIYEVPKPGTMDWRFADEPQRQFTERTLKRLANYVSERRALIRPFFKSLDPHNNGHLPRARFRQGLTISELHCSEAEMEAIEARFGNDSGVNYFAFLDIVEPSPKHEFKFIQRLKELRQTNQKPPMPELYPADSLEALLQKIKTKVYRERIRIDEWTRDYDKARTHRMLKSRFRRALDLCNLGLLDSEVCRLEDHYQSVGHPDYVDYMRFNDDIEAIFAEPHLERAPELEPRLFRVPDETQLNELVHDKLPLLNNCLARIAKRVKDTQVQLFPLFQDFDVSNIGVVTRNQFRRVLDNLKLAPYAPTETEWFCMYEKYQALRGNRCDVNYLDFCDAIYDLAGYPYRSP